MAVNPFDTVSAAAAILQISEQAWKVTSKAVEIYRSKDGTTQEMEGFVRMCEEYMRLGEWTEARAWSATGQLSHGEVRLRDAAVESRKAASDVLDFLKSLKVDGSWKAWKAVRLALKSSRTKREVQAHIKRLREQRMKLLMELQGVMFDRQESLTAHTEALLALHVPSPFAGMSDEDKTDLLKPLGVDTDVEGIRKSIKRSLTSVEKGGRIAPGLLVSLQEFLTDPRELSARRTILKSLRFDCRLDRLDRIKDAHGTTYEWIFDRASSERSGDFAHWLQSEDGLFWISGKAGCGKSTMLKFISGHRKTDAALMKWADGRRLFVASYYFWNPGTEMQKSQKGLLQSILHDILHQVPSLVQKVCPWRWDLDDVYLDRGRSWTLTELKKCIKLLVECQQTEDSNALPICFCLFIDGLDEYEANGSEGDHDEMLQLLQSLTGSTNFKACVSSRPWPVFLDAFEDLTLAGKRVEMHELTKDDILNYITDTLGPHIRHINSNNVEEAASLKRTLVLDIAEKAEGVFLWVYLVVHELIKGIRQRDRVQDLRYRLTLVPPHLEDYFRYMFWRTDDKVHRRRAAQVFMACGRAQRPMQLPAFALFDQTEAFETTLALDHKARDLDWLRPEATEKATRRIYGLCGDLLEVRKSIRHQSRPSALLTTVEFLHRSVKEYLDLDAVKEMMMQRAGDQYDAAAMLCLMNLFLLKKWYCFTVAGHVKEWPEDFLTMALELDRRGCSQTVTLLQSFQRVMEDSFVSNSGGTASDTVLRCRDMPSFVLMLKETGFSTRVLALLCDGPGPVDPLLPVDKKAEQRIFEDDDNDADDVQIREVKISDVDIRDLMIRDITATGATSYPHPLLGVQARKTDAPPKADGWLSWIFGR